MAMRLSPPSSKKFDSLPTARIEQLLPHRRHGALRFGGRFGQGGCGRGRFGAMPAKAFRSTFPFALKGHSSRTVTSWGTK